jgi:hypothetical protein
MLNNNGLDEIYINQFAALGVTNEQEIITILNGLDQVAEICYAWYVNNKIKKEYDNKS